MANRRQPESYRVAPREGTHRGKSENSTSNHSTYPRTNTVTEQINTLFSQAVDKMAAEVEQLKINFRVPEKPSDKLKCEGSSENRINDQFTYKVVSQKETDKVNQINVIPEEVFKRKNTMPMSLARKEDKIKLDTKKKQAEEENNKRLAEIIAKNASIQQQKVDLEQLTALQPREPVKRGSRPRPNKCITQGKRKRKLEATKKTGITVEELSD
ncbi:unnamed protein product [Orchesella dallaii]|uniref:Uncharacterized protein n=1 Tax=Orchesella dallaii TaxID=48710 RepID=A0ABP1RQG9_9HEXA